MDDPQRLLGSMAQSLAADSFPGTGTPFLVAYEYTESGVTERCGFLCMKNSVREAAEAFWNQHPGERFRLISVSGGGIDFYWVPEQGDFVTIPGRDGVE